jgi:dihydrofolate reductase
MKTKITMVMVSSLNSKITRGPDSDIYQWTSSEDSQMFFNFLKKSDMVIMGAKTYQTIRSKINLNSGPFRLIVTRHPDNYQKDVVTGKIEFTSASPLQIFDKFKNKFHNILLVGGSEINSLFLKSKLVDELYLTIEPLIFGNGKNIIAESELDINCNLLKIKKLNKKGTLLLIYKLNYEKN